MKVKTLMKILKEAHPDSEVTVSVDVEGGRIKADNRTIIRVFGDSVVEVIIPHHPPSGEPVVDRVTICIDDPYYTYGP